MARSWLGLGSGLGQKFAKFHVPTIVDLFAAADQSLFYKRLLINELRAVQSLLRAKTNNYHSQRTSRHHYGHLIRKPAHVND